jgi:cellulose synthase/poly-beta-1,6-N-acetylglucosamine synthase-like glycosyltransferase
MEVLRQVSLDAYVAVLSILAVYGLHRYVVLFLYYRYYKKAGRPDPPVLRPEEYPRVTVQLPIFNEYYVASRVIESIGTLDYPRELVTVQILDDSTDRTRDIARAAGERLRERGLRVQYLHRAKRDGFKAGALKFGLGHTSDELVAVFDADFVAPRDFLRRTVPYFKDERVGMVQARWGYLNREYSLLTRVQAILLDGHFMIEQTARSFSGHFFNFNGTGGVFRRRAIDDAGGWDGATLTEDLDLSYRAQMAGWKFIFLPDLVCESELPVDVYGLKTQQHRWTKGSIQVAKRLLPRIWKSRLPLRVKVEATFHLTSNLCYLLIVALSALLPVSLFSRRHAFLGGIDLWEIVVFVTATTSIFVFYAVSQRELYRDWKWRLRDIPFILALGIGMCINNARAVGEALVSHDTPFVRTSKYRIEALSDRWKGKLYHSADRRSLFLEAVFVLYMFVSVVVLFVHESWSAFPYIGLFVTGYAYILALSLLHARR